MLHKRAIAPPVDKSIDLKTDEFKVTFFFYDSCMPYATAHCIYTALLSNSDFWELSMHPSCTESLPFLGCKGFVANECNAFIQGDLEYRFKPYPDTTASIHLQGRDYIHVCVSGTYMWKAMSFLMSLVENYFMSKFIGSQPLQIACSMSCPLCLKHGHKTPFMFTCFHANRAAEMDLWCENCNVEIDLFTQR